MKQEAFSALLYIVRHVKSSSFRLKKVLEEKNSVMKVLNVAEKNDAAKNIAIQLSRNAFTRVSSDCSPKGWVSIPQLLVTFTHSN